mmetsp:Transcript_73087/g.209832  ORF Transcript_73087/g.209832 Transcript_73087/m.209832 type:complete len:387 (+) Transcript_73087:1133-2293(+)
MRHRVVRRDFAPVLVIHLASQRVAHADGGGATREQAIVHHEAAEDLNRPDVQQRSAATGIREPPHVADLAPGLRVEGAAVQHEADHGTTAAREALRGLHKAALGEDGADLRLRPDVPLVLLRVRGGRDAALLEVGGLLGDELQGPQALLLGLLLPLRLPGSFLLPLHELRERWKIHGEPGLLGHLLGEIDGEAVRVVEQEGSVAGHHLDPRALHLRLELCEVLHTSLDHPVEGLLLVAEDLLDPSQGARELGVGRAQRCHDHRHQVAEEAWGRIQHLPTITNRSTKDPSQHVAPALAGGHSSIGHGSRERSGMVDDDTIRGVPQVRVLGTQAAFVGSAADEFVQRVQEGREDVGVVVAPLRLQDGRHALQAHTRVDVLVGEFGELA